ERGAPPDRFLGKLAAVDRARHDDVGEQEIDALAAVDHLDRLDGVGSGVRGVAEAAQLRDDVLAHQPVVLDHQDGLAAAFGQSGRHTYGIAVALLAGARQVDLDGRAVTFLAVDLDVAARLLDQPVDHAEAETGALADLLGGEERLEHLVHDGGGNAAAGVADG